MRRPPRTVRARPLSGPIDPLAAIHALRRSGPVVALETTRASADHGRQTIVAGAPLAIFTWRRGAAEVEILREDALSLREGAQSLKDAAIGAATPFHALERLLERADLPRGEGDAPPIGAFGYFGYECVAPAGQPRLAPFPDAWFVICDQVVHWSEAGATPSLWSASGRDEDDHATLAMIDAIERSRGDAERTLAEAAADAEAARAAPGETLFERDDLPLARYARSFAAARAALAAGDSYQLCFTFPVDRRFEGDPLRLHARLRRENPAPFAAFVSAPFGAIASSSPERFLRVDRDGHVEARPMKGTAALAADVDARGRAARELVGGAKTRAENLMIADLLRNDLGRVCRLGSVRAPRPALLEEHATLLQLVSVIEGELAEGRTRADLLASAFPPGSMTGAPKERSIELLRALEPEPRGPYSGALGYLASDGRMDLSVVIRTALVAEGRARVNVGGGIVWDSTAESEYEECRLKAAPLLRALALRSTDAASAAKLGAVR